MFQYALYWQSIYIYIYIYNGCKNRSTYSSYTAGFLQAQELSEALKPLNMDFPGFQDSGHADTHTQSYLHCLKSICFFHRSKSLSEQSEPLCCTYWKTLFGFNTSYIQYVSMTVTVSIGLTSWMQSVCLVAVVQAFLLIHNQQPCSHVLSLMC